MSQIKCKGAVAEVRLLCREHMPNHYVHASALRGLDPPVHLKAHQESSTLAGDQQSTLIADLLSLTQHQTHAAGIAITASHMERQQKAVQVCQ